MHIVIQDLITITSKAFLKKGLNFGQNISQTLFLGRYAQIPDKYFQLDFIWLLTINLRQIEIKHFRSQTHIVLQRAIKGVIVEPLPACGIFRWELNFYDDFFCQSSIHVFSPRLLFFENYLIWGYCWIYVLDFSSTYRSSLKGCFCQCDGLLPFYAEGALTWN